MNDVLRSSLIGLALPFVMVLPPADSISAADRQDLLQLASEPAAAPEAPPPDTITWVNGAYGQSSLATPYQTAPFECFDGNTIFVSVHHYNWHLSQPTSVTDLAGNTYTQIRSEFIGTFDGMSIWYATNITGHAANVISFAGGSVFWSIVADQYSGTITITGTAFAFQAAGTTTVTSPSFNALPGLVYAVACTDTLSNGGGTWSAGSGLTKRTDDNLEIQASFDRSVSVAATLTAAASRETGVNKAIMVVHVAGFVGDPDESFPPPTINPPAGDPLGAIYFARIVHSGSTVVQRGETIIRNPADLWGGKMPSGLLKVGRHKRTMAFEGYPKADCTIELDDTPDRDTGVMFWRNLSATVTLEGAFVEVFRCHAPYGIIIGTPWRVFGGRVGEGGHKPIDGFRYAFTFTDILGELFADPELQPDVPTDRLTLAQFAGMLASFDGKVAPRAFGEVLEDGEGVIPMIPMGRINILTAFGSGLNLEVGVGLIAQQALYDVVDGYYNILSWEAARVTFEGEERRPTPDNAGYGYVFRAQNAGTTGGTEPTFPTTVGATVGDNGITWINAGIDDPNSRRKIPNEMYGVAGGLAVPHKPGWTAVTGLSTQYVIYGAPNRVYTPVLWDLSHPYSPYVESGAIVLTWEVVGAMTGMLSGTPILDPAEVWVHLLMNYYWHESDGITAGPMPMLPGLTGDYAAIDMERVAIAKAVGDGLGGLKTGMVLGATGEPEDAWQRMTTLQRFGMFRVGQNRHGQVFPFRKDYSAIATITLDEQRDHVSFEQWIATDRRGNVVRYQHSKRYLTQEPAASTGTWQPIAINGRILGEWASGQIELPDPVAQAAHEDSWGRRRERPIVMDMDTTRDAATAAIVANFALSEGTGEAPSYDGIRMFKITGPFERVLMRLGTDGKTLELGTVVAVTNSEGMTGTGYTLKRGLVTEVDVDPEADLVTVMGEILPTV